nr:archaetidylserine decarboxylase [Thiorhodovibrio litoralis]
MGARLFVWLQYALPQHRLSRMMLRLTRLRLGPVTHWLIRRFVAHFAVDLSEAATTRPESYASFNAFFTRALAAHARPLPDDPQALLSPVDGRVSEAGRIEGERLLQCKGQWFALRDLLGDDAIAAQFTDGWFATLYLSPRDYHRIHMPLAGRATQMLHVPGRLFSVNPTTVTGVPGLFARNERVVTVFDTDIGPMAMVLVGAIFVGSIETVWAGEITPPRAREVTRTDYTQTDTQTPIALARGEEMGRFNMGSTVILLLPAGAASLSPELTAGVQVRCRAPIGRLSGA